MKHVVIATAILTAILALLSCGKNKETNNTVALQLEHTVAGAPLTLNSIQYQAQSGHRYSVERLKYYISNVVLYRTDGSTYASDAVHYREEGIAATAELILPDVPDGEYTRLGFIVGLDETTNKPNGLPPTPENINMEWPIPGEEGYHYMKFEGRYDSMGAGVMKSFNLHTGAAKNQPYYVVVDLTLSGLSIDNDNWNITLQMDLNEWLQNPHTYDFEQFSPGIMTKPAAQQMLMENGASLFTARAAVRE